MTQHNVRAGDVHAQLVDPAAEVENATEGHSPRLQSLKGNGSR